MADSPPDMDWTKFAASVDEARRRYEHYQRRDPFPAIAPALLNAGDILDYVRITGMIHPFDPELHMKNASYEVALIGQCIHWDNNRNRREITIGLGDKLVLEPNSITFVEVEPTFRIPLYMVLRFNLKILHVHRGLLLGTGPLVDPGYVGKLLIPLHNLTTNEYVLTGGEGLIWVEFTKLSRSAGIDWEYDNLPRTQKVQEFPPESKERRLNDFLARAAPNREIRSSMGEFVALADAAQRHAEEARERIQRLAFWGLVGAIVGLGSLGIGLGVLYINLYNFVENKYTGMESALTDLQHRIQTLEGKADRQ